MFDEQQIAHTLELHKRTYELLMWLKQQANGNGAWLNQKAMEEMSSAKTCQDWVTRHCAMFPVVLRPAKDELGNFSHLFASFFATSFRVGLDRSWGAEKTTLVTGTKAFKGRRHRRYSGQRELDAALALKRAALTALAENSQVNCESAAIERCLTLEEYQPDLTLWTYACELVRRCQFATQGPVVHRLWLEIDEQVRKNLSADTVWNARSRLVQWLTGNPFRQEKPVQSGGNEL